jgi:DNA-binding MarR family transcriptional regulator
MHSLFFSIKRTHHRILAFGRNCFFKAIGLTPARYDMLHALRGTESDIIITQRRLRDILGVTAPTVSRMAISLEKLGLLTRKRSIADARQIIVRLTEEGLAKLATATRMAIGSGAVDLVVDSIFSFKWYSDARWAELYALEEILLYARRQLRDRAEILYFFHPDD